MDYTRLGNSGTIVSRLCIGTWHLPGNGSFNNGIENVDEAAFSRIFKKAYDNGINFFDTSNIYHGRVEHNEDCIKCTGNSERILGNIIKEYERESLVIATKVRGPMAGFPNGEGLSRKHIMWQIRESLKRLKTDYIDLYQIHWSDNNTPHNETMKTLSHLVDLDLVRYIGSSNVSASDVIDFMNIAEKNNYEKFITMQEPYNILNRSIEESKFDVARSMGLGILAYEPLEQGILSGKYMKSSTGRISYYRDLSRRIDETSEMVIRLSEIARKLDVTMAQLAIAWILKRSEEASINIIPILGVTNENYLDENLEALNININNTYMKMIDEL
ncbi:aldo/keto reductase [Picrophilus oshimae]|uniref:Oxidoreductase n=1 Tax=Picrophilus torridus (strain ATCC 700027 / DSM 9790 / JCM 10055 / NBRC 100828 / KAW 2/3) TaxID=1122961 RepID=Q6KZV8_PICTO|nr:aldo/keto reductase [Picrophilus oshimae]AAT43744.1 oxidoreductase [Picrophilus oshimae DSM 9789]